MGQQSMIAVVMISVLHYFFGIAVPLVMSVVLNVMGLLDDPLVRLYLRGHTPEYNKALVRPFKLANPMDNMKKLTEAWMPNEDDNATETSDGQSEKKSAKNSRA